MDGWRTARSTLVLLVMMAVGACSAQESEAPERTERERDSLIAQSRLPGAAGVGAAMRAQDKASAVNAKIDSIARSTTN